MSKTPRIRKDDIAIICSMYQGGHSLDILSIMYDRTIDTIKTYLRGNGIKLPVDNRRYKVCDDFFNKIDTEEKAYFLGMLYADGSHNIERNQFTLELIEDDKDLLEKLNNLVNKNRPLGYRIMKNTNWRNTFKLTCVSENLSSNLLKLGMMPRKDFQIIFPDFIPIDLLCHFCRGYNDGDGCISDDSIVIASNFEFCKGFKKAIEDNVGINAYAKATRVVEKGVSGNCLVHGRIQSIIFGDWLYNSATIYLERKFQKYLSMKDKLTNPGGRPTLFNEDGSRLSKDQLENRRKTKSAEQYQKRKENIRESRKSPSPGVMFCRITGKWRASVYDPLSLGKKSCFLGRFSTVEEAVKAQINSGLFATYSLFCKYKKSLISPKAP